MGETPSEMLDLRQMSMTNPRGAVLHRALSRLTLDGVNDRLLPDDERRVVAQAVHDFRWLLHDCPSTKWAVAVLREARRKVRALEKA